MYGSNPPGKRAMFRIAMFSQCQVECWHVIVDMNFLNFLKWNTKSWKTTVWDSNDSTKTGMGFVLSRYLFYLGFFGAAADFQLRIGFAFRWMLDRISSLVIDWNQRSSDMNFSFRFSFSHHFEKRIWISFFVFALLVIEKQIGVSFVIFAWIWKVD